MAWHPLVEADLLLSLTPAELDGFRNAAPNQTPPDGQSEEYDPVDGIIQQVAGLVRGYCGQKNQVDTTNELSVPITLLRVSTDLASWFIMQRAGGMVLDEKGARKDAFDKAMKTLEMVATGEIQVESPFNPDQYGTLGPTAQRAPLHEFKQWSGFSQRGLT